MNGRDCICVAAAVVAVVLAAMSFVSPQLHRGLAAVGRKSLSSSALIAETPRGNERKASQECLFREDDDEFTYTSTQTKLWFHSGWFSNLWKWKDQTCLSSLSLCDVIKGTFASLSQVGCSVWCHKRLFVAPNNLYLHSKIWWFWRTAVNRGLI